MCHIDFFDPIRKYNFRRLRNTRNLIHANLMISLFIRGAAFMLQHNSLNGKNGVYEFYSLVEETETGMLSETSFTLDYCEGSRMLMVNLLLIL
jgi:hypothetical protein